MPKELDDLRDRAEWKYLLGDYAFGAGWPHAVPDMLFRVVTRLQDTLDIMRFPYRIGLKRPPPRGTKGLLIIRGDTGIKRVGFKLNPDSIVLGAQLIYLAHADGVMNLVNAVLDKLQRSASALASQGGSTLMR